MANMDNIEVKDTKWHKYITYNEFIIKYDDLIGYDEIEDYFLNEFNWDDRITFMKGCAFAEDIVKSVINECVSEVNDFYESIPGTYQLSGISKDFESMLDPKIWKRLFILDQ